MPSRPSSTVIDSPARVHAWAARQGLLSIGREEMWALVLGSGDQLLFANRVAIGGIAGLPYETKDVLRAIQPTTTGPGRPRGFIVVHNHLSEPAKPSPADIAATKTLLRAVRGGRVRLLDHVVVSRTTFASMRDEGLLGR